MGTAIRLHKFTLIEDTAWSTEEERAGSFIHEEQQGLTLKRTQHELINKKEDSEGSYTHGGHSREIHS